MKNKVYQNVLIGMLTEEKYFLIGRYHEEQLGDHSMTLEVKSLMVSSCSRNICSLHRASHKTFQQCHKIPVKLTLSRHSSPGPLSLLLTHTSCKLNHVAFVVWLIYCI
jgi:hypothetical protein